MNLFKVNNLQALPHELHYNISMFQKDKYLAVSKHSMCTALLYLCSYSGICSIMNQILYPIEYIEWYLEALFIQDHVFIKNIVLKILTCYMIICT